MEFFVEFKKKNYITNVAANYPSSHIISYESTKLRSNLISVITNNTEE